MTGYLSGWAIMPTRDMGFVLQVDRPCIGVLSHIKNVTFLRAIRTNSFCCSLAVQKKFASVRTGCVFHSKNKFALVGSRKSKCMLETARQNKDVSIQYDYVDCYCKVEFHTRILHSYCKAVILLDCCLLFPY